MAVVDVFKNIAYGEHHPARISSEPVIKGLDGTEIYRLSRFNKPVAKNVLTEGKILKVAPAEGQVYVFVVSGDGIMKLNTTSQLVREGSLVCVNGGSVCQLKSDSTSEIQCLTVSNLRQNVARAMSILEQSTMTPHFPKANSKTRKLSPIAVATENRDNLFYNATFENGDESTDVTFGHSVILGEHGKRTTKSNMILFVHTGAMSLDINRRKEIVIFPGDAFFMPAGTDFNFRTRTNKAPVVYSAVLWGNNLDPLQIPGAKPMDPLDFGKRFRPAS